MGYIAVYWVIQGHIGGYRDREGYVQCLRAQTLNLKPP